VIQASIRDLEYHAELLSLLKLPPQLDRDAVMILHMGGVYGDKQGTLDRFRENYKSLPEDIKKRLVLENDDVSWSVHDLLPICKELNIPLVLDYHHHNIIHSDEVREGTLDIMSLYDEIRETWTRKGITQKMHYSEPTPSAVTARQRRKHSARVATLPPCPPDMDLMIEAKDKEQAVFELMRTFKLPGWDRFSNIIPHVRVDENVPVRRPRKKATPKKKAASRGNPEDGGDAGATGENNGEDDAAPKLIPDEEIGMGGPDGRVYWPPGMEEWLRPAKRVLKVKNPEENGDTKKRKRAVVKVDQSSVAAAAEKITVISANGTRFKRKEARAVGASRKIKLEDEMEEEESEELPDLSRSPSPASAPKRPMAPRRQSGRARRINYAELD
jgi:UV DNA damage endonuclease